MINIHLSYIHCDEETNEVGNDEPYVLVVSVALTPSVRGVTVQTPVASDVVVYPFRNMHTGGRAAFGEFESFWGIGGVPAALLNPDDAIFIVAMMENDSGDPQLARGLVDTAVNASLIESLAVSRPGKVTTLMRDVDSARRTPTGLPNFDDAIGAPQELRFSASELQRAESGQTVTKTMVFEGDGGRYTLMFDARNKAWRQFELAPDRSALATGGIAAASRRPDSMEIWWIGAEGSVRGAYWYEGQSGWRQYEIAPAGSASTDGGVAAVSRNPNTMEIWWIGVRGSIRDAFWYE